MFKDVKAIITRSPTTFLYDAMGASALAVILLVGLNLPVFF